jgi:DNA-directed RNA polymerase subunit N (RpoN/RPB10)
MNEGGEWNHYPYLKKVSFVILKLSEQGLSQQDIRVMANNKEIGEPPLSAPSVDRLYLELVRLKLIKKQIRNTRCWSCGKSIETNKDPDCSKCTTGIKCGSCGKCICERPKKLKKEDDYDYENPY